MMYCESNSAHLASVKFNDHDFFINILKRFALYMTWLFALLGNASFSEER